MEEWRLQIDNVLTDRRGWFQFLVADWLVAVFHRDSDDERSWTELNTSPSRRPGPAGREETPQYF